MWIMQKLNVQQVLQAFRVFYSYGALNVSKALLYSYLLPE